VKEYSVAEFCSFLNERMVEVQAGFLTTLTEIGSIIESDSKGRIGSYHAQVGPFPMWDELADSTKTERLAKGYSDDEPLYREGDLQNSISKEATPWLVLVGVKNGIPSRGKAEMADIAIWQEFGAARKGIPHIPPRPYLGPALYATMDKTLPIAAAAVMARLTGFPETEFLGKHFSMTPVRAMSAEVFAHGKALTGGR
jgi:hypothetical protein